MSTITVSSSHPTHRRSAFWVGALATGLISATSLVALTGTAAGAPIAPACAPITPATLSATVTQPTSVWDTVSVEFNGTLPAPPIAADACVVIPAADRLPLRSHGDYPALDANGVRVGTMWVDATGITFVFDEDYVNSHQHVSFHGAVVAGLQVDTSTAVEPFELTWSIPGVSEPVTVSVPGCPECGNVPEVSFKYAAVVDAENAINAGVVLGTGDWRNVPAGQDTAQVTLTDTLGPGQSCVAANVFNLSRNVKVTDVPCVGKNPIIATFTGTRGDAYRLTLRVRITDPSLTSYEDTGTIHIAGAADVIRTATAQWHTGSAGGTGVPRPSTTTSTSPTTTTSTTSTSPTTTTVTTTTAPTTTTVPTTTVTLPVVTPTTSTPTPTTSTPTPTTSTPTSTPTTPAPPRPTSTPAPTSTPSPTTVTLPAVTPTAPSSAPTKVVLPGVSGLVRRTYQVDRYQPRTWAQARAVAGFDDDRLLRYREDRSMWRANRYQFVTITVPAKATAKQLITAVNAATSRAIGDVRTTAKLPRAVPGRAYVMAWELGRGASIRYPWGPKKNIPQRLLARS